jgi:hypothetical protein
MSNGDVGWSLKTTKFEATWIKVYVRDKEGKGNGKMEEAKRNKNQRRNWVNQQEGEGGLNDNYHLGRGSV